MSETPPSSLEQVIRHAGEAWIIDSFSPPAAAMPRIHHLLQQANARLGVLFGPNAQFLSETRIVNEYQRSAHKIHAFIQALGQTESPDMLVMVWRILEGMEIRKIQLDYEMKDHFALQVTLVSPDGAAIEEYRSNDIDDAALLRHIGIMKMESRPMFDGFYPAPWAT